MKRLRPVELGPFDYEAEVYTDHLWIAEGLTSYYTYLALRRAGLCTTRELLKKLSERIHTLQTTTGRTVQSVEESSFDSWIKHYRPDENSPNTRISYYTKGAVIGFLLDLRIRRLTSGRKSLDDVMRLLYERFAGPGFTKEGFEKTVEDVAGQSLAAWLDTAVRSTDELDYGEALDWLGLEFKPARSGDENEKGDDDDGEDAEKDEKPKAWLGLVTRAEGTRLLVKEVRRETPALAAGLNAGDEIVALGGYRVLASDLKKRLEQFRPGDRISILVSRRGALLPLEATLGADPGKPWRLAVRKDASEAQKSRLDLWVRGDR